MPEGPNFQQATLLIPSISLAYGVGYALTVIDTTNENQVICSAEDYLIRFTLLERGEVYVDSNSKQSRAYQEIIHNEGHTNPKTAIWRGFWSNVKGDDSCRRDLIEALVEVMGDRVYG